MMDMNLETTTIIGGETQHTYPRLRAWLTRLMDASVYLAVVLVPLFFVPWTLDPLEIGKQTILLVLACVGVASWAGRALCDRRAVLTRSWLHLIVLVFIAGYGLASLVSSHRYTAFVGMNGQIPWSFVTMAACVVLYFLIANTVRSTTKLYHLVLAFLASSALVGILGLLQIFGAPFFESVLPPTVRLFNTIGSMNALAVFLVAPLVLAASLTVIGCKDGVCLLGEKSSKGIAAHTCVWMTMGVSLLVAICIDYWPVWVAILFGTALLVVIPLLRRVRVNHPIKIVVPSVLVGISVFFLVFASPLRSKVPAEVSPSASASWMIAKRTLQESPLFGSGPGTWVFDYAKYRSQSINMSQFWNVRFDRSLTSFFTLLATVGLTGGLLWLLVIISGIAKSSSHLILERNDDAWQVYLTIFTGWATTVFLFFFYSFTISHLLVFWVLTGLLAALVSRGSFTWNARASVTRASVLSIGFILLFVFSVCGIWLSVQRIVADVTYGRAVIAFRTRGPISEVISGISHAMTLNPFDDVYARNAAQAYLVATSQELLQAPDAESTKRVNQNVSLAVELAKRATDMAPMDVDNWANFAYVLQAISPFTKGADSRAIEIFQEAMRREPNNPTFPTEVAKLYVVQSDQHRQLAQSKDVAVKTQADKNVASALDHAADALNQAIQSKPDYAPAHYLLGLVYERQGRVKDAIGKLEQVLRANSRDVGVAFQLSILYYRDGQKEKSLNLLEQIVAFDPTYANARWYLSVLYEERRRVDDAIAQVQKVLESHPDTQAVKDRLTYLLQVRAQQTKPLPAALPDPVKEDVQSAANRANVR